MGQYVEVKLNGNYLTICELQVWVDEDLLPDLSDLPTFVNVALDATAITASEQGWGAKAGIINITNCLTRPTDKFFKQLN